MDWIVGKDSHGRVPVCGDPPRPVFMTADGKKGRYFIAYTRDAKTGNWLSELWLVNAEGRTPLEFRITQHKAKQLAEVHDNGVLAQAS